MVVMDYANKGNLRGILAKIIESNWYQRLFMLHQIISGLERIHKRNLIHCDFHDGNILNHKEYDKDEVFISDLGLCQPIKSFLKSGDIYGVIPFMVPEVLRGKQYTQASDIYSFSMIMPSAKEVSNITTDWIFRPYYKEISKELKNNIMEFINAPIGYNNPITKSHPQAYYTSRLLDFTSRKVNEILESECSNYIIVNDESSEKLDETVKSECVDCTVSLFGM
ncbi:hypothetical protein RclHR1_07500009 [Rhizophagus clarus]|uniref:Protein kinase domain-containing protein n=1 Tax=Rhizophagus clarus TaxID=94130 RepID=A0A2Z6RXI0_9GLOM|nr:hypothetical protein RclHR1_07500009 [Rhizophagus clarus]